MTLETATKDSVGERFMRLAESTNPAEALAQVAGSGPDKERAFAALLTAWIRNSTMDPSKKEKLLDRIQIMESKGENLIVMASLLNDEALAEYRAPFLQAFSDSPVRSSLLAGLTGLDASANPAKLTEICRDWLPWEQATFLRAASQQWAGFHPELARDWCLQHPGANDRMQGEAIAWLARRDPEMGRKLLETSNSTVERAAAAGVLAHKFAVEDTRKAVEWANLLPEGPVKDAAHEAIYQAVPRGVGAVLRRSDDGLPVIQTIMPEGPFSRAGFQSGDVLAGIESASGGWQGFSGAKLEDVTGQLRGEPGTQLTVVGMRRDSATGQWMEFRKVVSREQLVIRGKEP